MMRRTPSFEYVAITLGTLLISIHLIDLEQYSYIFMSLVVMYSTCPGTGISAMLRILQPGSVRGSGSRRHSASGPELAFYITSQ